MRYIDKNTGKAEGNGKQMNIWRMNAERLTR